MNPLNLKAHDILILASHNGLVEPFATGMQLLCTDNYHVKRSGGAKGEMNTKDDTIM